MTRWTSKGLHGSRLGFPWNPDPVRTTEGDGILRAVYAQGMPSHLRNGAALSLFACAVRFHVGGFHPGERAARRTGVLDAGGWIG